MSRPRVALLVETSLGYGREVIEGVADFVEAHEDWSIFLEQRELGVAPPRWLTHRHWNGIISRVTTPRLAATIRRLGMSVVDLTDRSSNLGLPRILSDHVAIGRLAAEHLLERGFTTFGFCGFTGEAWSVDRLRGFRQRIEAAGFQCEVYESSWIGPSALPWDVDEERIGGWLNTLPLPVGVMACNDLRGQQVLESCRRTRLSVPDQVAVVGVDNDRLLCRLSDPPLSSVLTSARRIGFEAAALLSRQMNGETCPPEDHAVAPVRVVPRRSSDTFAVEDVEVAAALRFIQEHACGGLRVDDVLKHVSASRSLLERRFRERLGRTPHAQIRQVQLDRVIELLTETELPLKQVALRCGFAHVEYLSYLFKKHIRMTPGDYRRQFGDLARRGSGVSESPPA